MKMATLGSVWKATKFSNLTWKATSLMKFPSEIQSCNMEIRLSTWKKLGLTLYWHGLEIFVWKCQKWEIKGKVLVLTLMDTCVPTAWKYFSPKKHFSRSTWTCTLGLSFVTAVRYHANKWNVYINSHIHVRLSKLTSFNCYGTRRPAHFLASIAPRLLNISLSFWIIWRSTSYLFNAMKCPIKCFE